MRVNEFSRQKKNLTKNDAGNSETPPPADGKTADEVTTNESQRSQARSAVMRGARDGYRQLRGIFELTPEVIQQIV